MHSVIGCIRVSIFISEISDFGPFLEAFPFGGGGGRGVLHWFLLVLANFDQGRQTIATLQGFWGSSRE